MTEPMQTVKRSLAGGVNSLAYRKYNLKDDCNIQSLQRFIPCVNNVCLQTFQFYTTS